MAELLHAKQLKSKSRSKDLCEDLHNIVELGSRDGKPICQYEVVLVWPRQRLLAGRRNSVLEAYPKGVIAADQKAPGQSTATTSKYEMHLELQLTYKGFGECISVFVHHK